MKIKKENRFLLWIDILGFKDFIHNNSDDVIEEIMDSILAYPTSFPEYSEYTKSLDFLIISDTIIIATSKGQKFDFIALGLISQIIADKLLENEFIFRGCISFGEFKYSKSKYGVYIYGDTVIEAASIEPTIDMICIVCGTSCTQFLENEGEQWSDYSVISDPYTGEKFQEWSIMQVYDFQNILFKDGVHKFLMVKWFLPHIPLAIEKYFYQLQKKLLNHKKKTTFNALRSIYRKILNSRELINTIYFDDRIYKGYNLGIKVNETNIRERWSNLLMDVKETQNQLNLAIEEINKNDFL